jgi:hypothetical protein
MRRQLLTTPYPSPPQHSTLLSGAASPCLWLSLLLSVFASIGFCFYRPLLLSVFASIGLCFYRLLLLSAFASIGLCFYQSLLLSAFMPCGNYFDREPRLENYERPPLCLYVFCFCLLLLAHNVPGLPNPKGRHAICAFSFQQMA